MVFQWATVDECLGFPRVADLEQAGWVRSGRHPFYPETFLMECLDPSGVPPHPSSGPAAAAP